MNDHLKNPITESNVKVVFRYSESDLMEFEKGKLFRNPIIWTFALGSLVCLFLGISLILGIFPNYSPKDELFVLFGIPLFVFALVVFRLLRTRSKVREVLRDPRAQRDCEFSFSIEGVHIKTDISESKASWIAFDKVTETELFFILQVANNGYLIPKSAFRNPNDTFRLRELFRDKLGKMAKLLA